MTVTASATQMIEIDGLWKRFDDLAAVRDFTLQVEPRTTMGLIGPNGSGKTTLLRMVSTLAKPDRGSIRIAGIDALEEPRAVRQQLAFMPAEFGMPRDMQIGEYMEYFACAMGVNRRTRKRMIDDVLELTDLRGREEVLVHTLSTGNKQRLLLAKTLLGDRDLLILDEPASGLDPRARAEIRVLLRELAAMGKTILISSHILADLEDICDAVCIIEQGQHVTSGRINDLRRQYAAPQRLVHIQVQPEALEMAQAHLEALAGVGSVRIVDNRLSVETLQDSANPLLKVLIDHDIEILAMREELPDLEDIFIESTKGVVS